MNTLSKVVIASVVSFSVGAALATLVAAYEHEKEYANNRSSLLLAAALASSVRFVWSVEDGRVNAQTQSIDSSLCWLSRLVKDQVDRGFDTAGNDYFVARAQERIQMLIKRESPATMPAYDNLLPCADPPRNAATSSPEVPTESLAKR